MSVFTSVFDQDLVLPGAITEIQSDYSYGYDTSSFGTTDAVTIIGTAFNGPVGSPVPIYSPDHARYIFGNSYDSAARKEATLVANIQDAWDRGARTIYAVRLSGKAIAKDFQFSIDTTLKLRVAGLFPSNANKQIYMTYDDTTGAESISIYKPASRATINEKMTGVVESDNSILVTTFDLNGTYGLTKDSRLVDLINIINEYGDNNVLKLSIVDAAGTDVTVASQEAQQLSIGILFPGAYFVGRDTNKAIAETDLSYVPVTTAAEKPFSSFTGLVYKKLTLNTDITASLPIYGTLQLLNTKLQNSGIKMSTLWDFLSIVGKADEVFAPDSTDYEEINLSDFEVYQKLGSGYAIAAKVVNKVEGDASKGVKVVEAPVSDTNRIVQISDGIYSMLENLKSKYRVLANGTVDRTITGKIPRKSEFSVAVANSFNAMAGYITATTVVNNDDLTQPKKYTFTVDSLDVSKLPTKYSDVYMDEVIKRVGIVGSAAEIATMEANGEIYPNGTLFLVSQGSEYVLYRYNNGNFDVMKDVTSFSNLVNKLLVARIGDTDKLFKGSIDATDPANQFVCFNAIDKSQVGSGTFSFILVESAEIVSVYALASSGAVTALGEISEVFSTEADKTIIAIQSDYKTKNNIDIRSSELDYMTLSEFVDALNENENVAKFFTFSISNDHIGDKDEYVQDIIIEDFSLAKAQSTTDGYKIGSKVLYHGVLYVAKTDIDPASTSSFVVSTDPTSGWNPVDIKYKVWKAETAYVVGDLVISTDSDPKPYITITAHTSAAGATFTDDSANFVEDIYEDNKSIGYNMNLYIPYKTTDNFARHLAQHCTYTSLKNDPTHGIIGCDRIVNVNLNTVANKVNTLLGLDVNYYAKKNNGREMLDNNNLPYPIGRCISVVFGQYIEVDDATSYNYISNGAAGYAGMVSNLSLEQSSTNQAISIPTPMFDLTNFQLTQLTQKGIVTFKNSYNGSYVVTDGITMAPAASPFKRLSVSRIVNEMENRIRSACEPFIGKQNHLSNRNSMQTAIKSNLEAMKGTLLESYSFNLLTDSSSKKLGIIYVDYSAVPIYEIKEVRSRITLKDSI